MTSLRAVKGMNDVLPDEIARWHRVESTFARAMTLHGYREVRTPVVEPTPLFVRTVGETTDIVEKEMYSFRHHDDELTLRPEGTAGAARAYVEHGVFNREPVTRWYYLGPMFRAERPQRGRYRQFWQVGGEVFGDAGPGVDAEMIGMLAAILETLGVRDLRVLVNSLGGPGTRARYREALVKHLEPMKAQLSPDSQRRLLSNPLRILDSKDPRDQAAIAGAPAITDVLDEADAAHWKALSAHLEALGLRFEHEPRLVRGLDYYTRTLFEIKGATDKLGAGDTLVGGGRYDAMVSDLGGPSIPAIGFAAGIERIIVASDAEVQAPPVDVVVSTLGAEAVGYGLLLGRDLRRAGIACEVDARDGSLKSKLRRANALGARITLIAGEDEVRGSQVQLKDMAAQTQAEVARGDVVAAVASRLGVG